MQLIVLTLVLLVALFGAFVMDRTRFASPRRNAGGDDQDPSSLFTWAGYSSRFDRALVVSGFPLLGCYLIHVVRVLNPVPRLMPYLGWSQTIVLTICVWQCVWSASDLPAEQTTARVRRMVLDWYRATWSWTVFGLFGFAFTDLVFSPPSEALFGGGHGVGVLVAHWCFRYFVDLALPVTEEDENLERESERVADVLTVPLRLVLGFLLIVTELITGGIFDNGRHITAAIYPKYILLMTWLLWWRMGLASRRMARALPGHRLFTVRQGMKLVRSSCAMDREVRMSMPSEWTPEVRYRRGPEPRHGAWDLTLQGLLLFCGFSLPLLALWPQIVLFGLPAFWTLAGLAIFGTCAMASERCFSEKAAPLVSVSLAFSWLVSPNVALGYPVLSTVVLMWVWVRSCQFWTPGPMVAAGRPGRWWLAVLPVGPGKPLRSPAPLAELPLTGWVCVPADEDVPWSKLWRSWTPRDRVRPVAVLATLALVALGAWPLHQFALELLPVFPLSIALRMPVDAMLARGRIPESLERTREAVRISPSAVWALISLAQAAHDSGRTTECQVNLKAAEDRLRGWQVERVLRLRVGMERQAQLAEKASRVQVPSWLGRQADAVRTLELARLMDEVPFWWLGYASEVASTREAWTLACEAVSRIPDEPIARLDWTLRALEKERARALVEPSPNHPWSRWTVLDSMIGRPWP